MYIYIYIYIYTHTYTYIHTYMYIYIYIERERDVFDEADKRHSCPRRRLRRGQGRKSQNEPGTDQACPRPVRVNVISSMIGLNGLGIINHNINMFKLRCNIDW